ncbi:MAG TPA: ATP synthase F1 subunit gamma [Nitrospirales bacterium]|jgi:F-type H+-transporting ATPase subunit gamma|nr:ATP synthase F1 subunit gamma [Nitrospirales bacterium]
MPSLQGLRRKIGSIKNTQKITKAMKMVAAAKLKRAQERILAARPYAKKMAVVLGSLASRANRTAHPLLRKPSGNRIELLVVTSDRGLCGAFNTNILRKALEFLRERQEAGCTVTVSVIGRKGRDFFRRRPWTRRQEWVGVFDRLSYEHALDIGGDIVQQFTSGTFDELHIVYNEFKSVIQQRVVVEKLLPIESLDQEAEKLGGGYLFEPDEEELLKVLLPKHIEVQTFHALMESSAAELGARMAAMDGATRNAGELIKKMTLYYNKTRQAAITKELMDIVGGAEALR